MRLARLPGIRRAAQSAGPLNGDAVLFDSWRGQYSDSPRAISEELRRRGAQLEHIWVLDDAGRATAPDWVTPVAPGSARHLNQLGRSRYLIANNTMPGFFHKNMGTTYLQTWHGTPLKRIAFDVENPTFPGARKYLANLVGEVRNWDLLVSPNHFSTEIFRQAFRYDGEVVETGYPRNDLLTSSGAGAVRDATRSELGIARDERAVLYAPTWREGSTFSLQLGMSEIAAALGDGHRLLLRAHTLDAADVDLAGQQSVLDVSGYGDIRELYLATDVLITDYSSVMFDFAVTGKPMLFFTYDLDEYRDRLRGFYFDFENEAPGPLLSDAADILEALTELDSVVADSRPAYAAFREKFCHLDDGGASRRVVDAMLST